MATGESKISVQIPKAKLGLTGHIDNAAEHARIVLELTDLETMKRVDVAVDSLDSEGSLSGVLERMCRSLEKQYPQLTGKVSHHEGRVFTVDLGATDGAVEGMWIVPVVEDFWIDEDTGEVLDDDHYFGGIGRIVDVRADSSKCVVLPGQDASEIEVGIPVMTL